MATRIAKSTNTSFEDILHSKFYALDSLKEEAIEQANSEGLRGFRQWLDTPEGSESLISYRRFLDHYLDSLCTKIIDKSVMLLLDRLTFGDVRYTEGGVPYREEIRALPLSKIMASVFDRRQLLRDKPTLIAKNNDESLEESLELVAERLNSLGSISKRMVSVTVAEKLERTIVQEVFDSAD